jgi:hypothetical protein
MFHFRVRIIPVTVLWGLAGAMFIGSVVLFDSLVSDVLRGAWQSCDLKLRWGPLFAAALLAWSMPMGISAFAAGYFIYKGRWKAAVFAILILCVLWFVCLLPFLWVLTSYPGPL